MNLTSLAAKIATTEPVDLFIDAFVSFDNLLNTYVPVPAALSPFLESLNAYKAPHAKSLPLMNPFYALLLIVTYLVVIHSGVVVMKSFQRVNVSTLAFWHNIFLTWLSAYMGFGILSEAVRNRYSVFRTPVDDSPNGWPMAKMLWLFYVSKIFEFVDTLIMVLKKNNHQISFLHLYHHSSILLVTGVSVFYSPGGEVYLSSMLNCFVHVIMYGYYFLSSMNVKQVVFIKKYITMIQLTQFCINLVQATFIAFVFPVYAWVQGIELAASLLSDGSEEGSGAVGGVEEEQLQQQEGGVMDLDDFVGVGFLRSDTRTFHAAQRPNNNNSANTTYYDTFNRHPPPNFDKWLTFANQRNCSTRLKDYSIIYDKLDPWFQRGGIPAEQVDQFEEHWDMKVLQFVDGKFTGDERFLEGRMELFDAVSGLLGAKGFRFVLNQLDEPVGVPADDSKVEYRSRNLSEESVMRYLFGCSECFRREFKGYAVKESPEWVQFGEGVEYVHSFMQQPAFYDTKVRNTQIPVFSQCTTACHSDVPIPLKYHVETARNPPRDVVPWKEKRDVVFWRGSTTGGRYIVGAPWRMYHRTRLVQWGVQFGRRYVNSTFDASREEVPRGVKVAVDVGFHVFTQQDAVTEGELMKEYGVKGYVSLERSLRFKYLVVVDGYAWPSRLQQYLASNSVVLYNGIFLDFFSARLKPWVHYVPFRLDYSDLEERLVWLMENDEVARKISENARRLMAGVNRMQVLECYTGLLFLEYSHLYDKDVVG
ncbi:hypothetical protein HDU81_008635 [Chytriomyces hyalinus]|nr:hypothetical protein HDU81_008635 [Chytriomyces hyalinus]